jgi:ABC-type uncharacterized transport system permease subunit
VLAGLLFGALHAGAPLMQAVTGTPVDMVQVLQAVIVLFVAAPPLIRAMYRLRGTLAPAAWVGVDVQGVERVTPRGRRPAAGRPGCCHRPSR